MKVAIPNTGGPSAPSAPSTPAPSAPSAPSTPSAPASTTSVNPFGGTGKIAPAFNNRAAPRNYPELETESEFDDIFGVTPKDNGDKTPARNVFKKDEAASPETDGDKEFDESNLSFDLAGKKAEVAEDDDLPDAEAEAETTPLAPQKRNYEEYDEEVQKVLRKFPNALYDRFGKQINEWKIQADKVKVVQAEMEKLKSEDKTPKYLAEHPNAYQLHPGYTEIAQTYRDAQFETNHWREQLMAIKSGEAWSELKGYRQDGSPVIEEHPGREDGRVDTSAEIMVSQYLNTAMTVGMQTQQKAQQFIGQYQQFQKTASQELQDSKAKFFPDMDHKKFDKGESKMWQAAYDCIPLAYQNHPLAEIIPYSFVAIQRLANYTQGLEKKLGLKKTPRSVGPKNLPSTPGKPAAGVIDMDTFFEGD
jgi:hypothetical protein